MNTKEIEVDGVNVAVNEEIFNKLNMVRVEYSVKKKRKLTWSEFFNLLLNLEKKGKDIISIKNEFSMRKKKDLTWDEFFEFLLKREKIKKSAKSWLYTISIFIAITFILMFPFYFGVPSRALLMLPIILLVGFIVAFFSAYILTPFTLKGIKPFENAPPELTETIDEFRKKSGIKRKIKLMIAETPQINAMAYTSIFDNRICITTGLLKAYEDGKINEEEMKAIIGHEIGHIKNLDCFRMAFVISWISIFSMLGTLLIIIGNVISGAGLVIGATSREKGAGAAARIIGLISIIAGFIMKIIAKVASILALHHSRKIEYHADMVGAELTTPTTMANSLEKIDRLNDELIAKELASLPYAERWQIEPKNLSWVDRLFLTHPPMNKRLHALKTVNEFL